MHRLKFELPKVETDLEKLRRLHKEAKRLIGGKVNGNKVERVTEITPEESNFIFTLIVNQNEEFLTIGTNLPSFKESDTYFKYLRWYKCSWEHPTEMKHPHLEKIESFHEEAKGLIGGYLDGYLIDEVTDISTTKEGGYWFEIRTCKTRTYIDTDSDIRTGKYGYRIDTDSEYFKSSNSLFEHMKDNNYKYEPPTEETDKEKIARLHEEAQSLIGGIINGEKVTEVTDITIEGNFAKRYSFTIKYGKSVTNVDTRYLAFKHFKNIFSLLGYYNHTYELPSEENQNELDF